jgi:hypothetical protein
VDVLYLGNNLERLGFAQKPPTLVLEGKMLCIESGNLLIGRRERAEHKGLIMINREWWTGASGASTWPTRSSERARCGSCESPGRRREYSKYRRVARASRHGKMRRPRCESPRQDAASTVRVATARCGVHGASRHRVPARGCLHQGPTLLQWKACVESILRVGKTVIGTYGASVLKREWIVRALESALKRGVST